MINADDITDTHTHIMNATCETKSHDHKHTNCSLDVDQSHQLDEFALHH